MPFAGPPMDVLQGMLPALEKLLVISNVLFPVLAPARHASIPVSILTHQFAFVIIPQMHYYGVKFNQKCWWYDIMKTVMNDERKRYFKDL